MWSNIGALGYSRNDANKSICLRNVGLILKPSIEPHHYKQKHI